MAYWIWKKFEKINKEKSIIWWTNKVYWTFFDYKLN